MLHQIKLPAYVAILKEFIEFQRRLLGLACTISEGGCVEMDEAMVRDVFRPPLDDWFWRKLWKRNHEASDLAQALRQANEYINGHPEEREKILNAFDHDIDFPHFFDDSTFRFEYQRLSKASQDAIQSLMVACYQLLCDGFPSLISKLSLQEKFDHQRLVKEFWLYHQKRLRVCPACDGKPPVITSKRVNSDIDHFFPKSLYPFLSVHPLNLVPICTDCNRYIKKQTDPIGNHSNESLVDIFHPFERPAAQYIEIHILAVAKGAGKICIAEKSPTNSQRGSVRIRNLNRVSCLEEIWSGSCLDDVVEEFERRIRELGYRAERPIGNSTNKELRAFAKEEVKAFLEPILLDYANSIGKEQNYLLKRSYVHYVLTQPEELQRLVDVFLNNIKHEGDGEEEIHKF